MMFNVRNICLLKREGGGYGAQYLAGFSAALTLFCGGLHFGWSMPSLKKIMSEEYPFKITEAKASYIVITGPIGHIIGGITGSILSDLIGRKCTVLAIAIPQVLAFTLIYFSYLGTEFLFVARIAGGIGEGASLAIVPLYLAEVALPKVRGVLGLFCGMCYPLGSLFINVLGSFLDIYRTALVCLVFPILFLMTFSNMPESPYYLLMKLRVEEAMESLQVLRRNTQVGEELITLRQDVTRQMSEPRGFKYLFKIYSNRKALLIVILCRIFQQLTGIAAFGMYYQLLIERSTNLSPLMGSSILILLQIGVNSLSCLFIDKVGRKPLLVLSSGLSFIILAMLGTFFILTDFLHFDLKHLSWLPLPLMVLFVISFSIGLGSATMILISEMFSASIKSKAIAVASIIYAVSMMSTTKYYQYTSDNYSLAIPFLTFAFFTLVGCLFFLLFLPETKGKTLETIQQELKGKF